MSRLDAARAAVRPALKARMSVAGPSGSGKTRSMLIIATVLADGGKILGVDTERESMLTYADDFDFTHLPWRPPYHPGELADVLLEASDTYAVVIVDSLSHFWRGTGGTLDISTGKFTGWKEARPVQETMIDALLAARCHVLVGLRAKVEYVQEARQGGGHQVTKLGMASQQDDTLEYELNIAVDMAMDHTATIAKSRTTSLPVLATFKGHQMAQMAETYKQWLDRGEPVADAAVAKRLAARMNGLPEGPRKQCKAEFVARFGRPEQLRASLVDDAEAMVAGYEQTEPLPDAVVPA